MFKRNISLLSSTSVMSNKKDESEPKVKVRQVSNTMKEDFPLAKSFSNPISTERKLSISEFQSNPVLREAQDSDLSSLNYPDLSLLNQNKKIEQKLGKILIDSDLGKQLTQKAIDIGKDGFGVNFEHIVRENKESIVKKAYKIGGANELLKGILSLDSVFLALEDYYLDSGVYDIKTLAQQAAGHGLSKREYLSEVSCELHKTVGAEPFGPYDYLGRKTVAQEEFSEAMKQRRSNYFNTVTADNRAFGGTSYHQWYDVNPNRIDKWEKLPKKWQARVIKLSGESEEKVKAKFETSPELKSDFLQGIGFYKSTSEFTHDLMLDETVDGIRRHDAGENSNILRRSQKGVPEVEHMVTLAIDNNRPLISGMSGHTVKFLNAFANLRHYYISIRNNQSATEKQLIAATRKLEKLPTLNEARIICMANLLPPKSHHSYFEIMAASEGISDGETKLQFNDIGGYSDLKADEFGDKVYKRLFTNE